MNTDKARGDEHIGFDRQYDALRSGGGLVELADWSSVTLTGVDRSTFLHNFCTNDVKRLTPESNCEAFFCNVKGRVIGHGLVICRENELVVVGSPGQSAALAAHLDRYVIREDVQVRDTSNRRRYLLVSGSADAHDRLTSWVGRFAFPPVPWKLVNAPFVSLVECAPASLADAIVALTAAGFVECRPAVWNSARIEAGTPLWGVDFGDENFPQEIGRNDEAISFTKGCYLGQETVARIDALGHVNQQIAGVAFSGTAVPETGTLLTHNDASVGRITSAAYVPALSRPLALAMVRRGHHEVGTRLETAAGTGEVVALPVNSRPAQN